MHHRRVPWGSIRVLIGTFMFLSSPVWSVSAALADTEDPLFSRTSWPLSPNPLVDSVTIRGRSALVNLAALQLGQESGPEFLELNLFEDVIVRATRHSFKRRGLRDFSWRGQAADGATVSLVFIDDSLGANIVTRSSAYEVRPVDGRLHEIREVRWELADLTCGVTTAESHEQDIIGNAASQSASDGPPVQIDVMIVYTPAARGPDIDIVSQLAIDDANQAFINTGINAEYRLVYTSLVDYTELPSMKAMLKQLENTNDGKLDAVHCLRDTVGADLVCLLVKGPIGGPHDGIAQQLNPLHGSDRAFSVVKKHLAGGSGAWVLAHELGHNLGANHNRDVTGWTPCSKGYEFTGNSGQKFLTLMAKDKDTKPPTLRILQFSNPMIDFDGVPTGTDCEFPFGIFDANNAETLAETTSFVWTYKTPGVGDPLPICEACTPLAGDCFSPHGEPGCAVFACCEQVCTILPSCCTTVWDEFCVDLACELCDPVPLASDLNGDLVVDFHDVAMLLSNWGKNETAFDLDHTGVIDDGDLAVLLSELGNEGGDYCPYGMNAMGPQSRWLSIAASLSCAILFAFAFTSSLRFRASRQVRESQCGASEKKEQ